MMNEPKCECPLFTGMGDASPRLWECPKHGKTGMIGPMRMINKLAEVWSWHPDLIWDDAKWCLDFCRAELMNQKNVIFYCEDRWEEVLAPFFRLYPGQVGMKRRNAVVSNPGLILDEFASPPEEEIKELRKQNRGWDLWIVFFLGCAFGLLVRELL